MGTGPTGLSAFSNADQEGILPALLHALVGILLRAIGLVASTSGFALLQLVRVERLKAGTGSRVALASVLRFTALTAVHCQLKLCAQDSEA